MYQDENGYYIEIDTQNMTGGTTLNFNVSMGYPNETSAGGSVTVSGAIGTENKTESLAFKWYTQTDTYSVKKSTSGTPTFVSNEDGNIYLTGLKYTVIPTRSPASSYGKDHVAKFTYADTLVLPNGLSWRDGLLDAIDPL
ncbi:MAG: hypothetical protein LIO78_05905 [Clostridiales bacterium]|nr:hypothetical protein [Bacteroidales bacterium]MCC8099581.1 hypothetical protein [Clostridiales bacterium]